MASFTERYHEYTKYNPNTIDRVGPTRWENQPMPFKPFQAKERIDLLPALQIVMEDLEGEPMTSPDDPAAGMETLARLLFFTMGLTSRMLGGGSDDLFLRAAPSAGGLYPTEIYVAVRNRPGAADGIYHYHSLRSSLIPVWQGAFWADLKHYFLGHPAVDACDTLFLFTGLYSRSAWRYKERAYRRILLDTGHAVGNLLEACRQGGLDYALLGGFLDGGLEELLFLEPKEEFPLLGVALGPRGKLPASIGQRPGDPPVEAVRHLVASDPMQVQQNSCERIRSAAALRNPILAPCGSPPFEPHAFNALKTILKRRSCRKFSGGEITLAEAKECLAFSLRQEGQPWCLAPGHLDLHVVALGIEGLEPGVYKLNPFSLGLEPKRVGDFRSEALYICLGQELASECAMVLVHTSDLAALAQAYGDRGYRYACMDAGQIGERVNLWAVHAGLGSSGIGGYYDDQANELLGLPLSHGILYITLLGKADPREDL